MTARERDVDQTERMSEHEALMWNVEKDPWLNPSGAALFVFDRPIDRDRLRERMQAAVAGLPRLYQRVQPGIGRISTPAWVPDPEFDFDFHFQTLHLPSPGTERQLLDLAAQLYVEPLDRTRPLWRMVVIEGLETGEGALWSLVHHAIADGIGQLRMAELFQDRERDAPGPEPVDLDAVVASAVAEHDRLEGGGDLGGSFVGAAAHTATHVIRRTAGATRRAAGEVAIWPADPSRVKERADDITTLVRSTADQLRGAQGEGIVGAPLFRGRSRHRHLEHVNVELDALKAAGRGLGLTVNEAFMTVMAEATTRYHEARDVPFDVLNATFVVSTRTDDLAGGNAFTPVAVQLPAGPMTLTARADAVRAVMADARATVSRGGGFTALSGVINLLPTSVVTRTARSQAAHIDLATSNLRGAPFPLFVGGAEVRHSVTMGPLAGTPVNATALSYRNSFDIGLFIDPVAIKEPTAFRDGVEATFAELLA